MSTECDREASIVRGPWPTRGCRDIKRNVFMGRPYVIIGLKYAKEMPGSDTRKWGYKRCLLSCSFPSVVNVPKKVTLYRRMADCFI